jgi:pimeloyl-ACP methyl ester carboxylesterase
MIYLWIALALILMILLLFVMMMRSFKIKPEKHLKTPADHGIAFEEVRYPTKNGKQLYAWWVPDNSNAPTLILVHGWGRSAGRLMPYIKNLYGKGFNLLAFDSRNHGESDEDDFSSMLKFAEDICAGIDFVIDEKQLKNQDIYLLGLSIGGAASIYSAAHDHRIKKVITIGAPANPADVMAYQMKKKHIPKAFIWMLFEIIQFRIGIRFKNLSAEKNIRQAIAQFLIIHGEKDRVVLLDQGEKLFWATKPEHAEFWVISDAGHSNCHYKAGFWEKILGFLNEGND